MIEDYRQFWRTFRKLPYEEKVRRFREKVESTLPLERFVLAWISPAPSIILGYRGPFKMRIEWHMEHPYDERQDNVTITLAPLKIPFGSSYLIQQSDGSDCVGWFLSYYVYGHIKKSSPETNLSRAIWGWAREQLKRQHPQFQNWLPPEQGLHKEAFLLEHFDIDAVARVFDQEWEDFRAYFMACEQVWATTFLPPRTPCP